MFICLMEPSVQQKEPCAVLWRTIKPRQVWEYLKYFSLLLAPISSLTSNKRSRKKRKRLKSPKNQNNLSRTNPKKKLKKSLRKWNKKHKKRKNKRLNKLDQVDVDSLYHLISLNITTFLKGTKNLCKSEVCSLVYFLKCGSSQTKSYRILFTIKATMGIWLTTSDHLRTSSFHFCNTSSSSHDHQVSSQQIL